ITFCKICIINKAMILYCTQDICFCFICKLILHEAIQEIICRSVRSIKWLSNNKGEGSICQMCERWLFLNFWFFNYGRRHILFPLHFLATHKLFRAYMQLFDCSLYTSLNEKAVSLSTNDYCWDRKMLVPLQAM